MLKQILITVVCLAACVAEARSFTPAQLPPPIHADAEVSTNVSFTFEQQSLKEYRLTVGFVPTPSNNVEVVLGKDADGDGDLSFQEEGLIMGCECGEWFARSGIGDWGLGIGNCETGTVSFVTYGPDTNGYVTAVVDVSIRRHKSDPGWLYDRTWNTMRITLRGVDEAEECINLWTRVSGTLILIK